MKHSLHLLLNIRLFCQASSSKFPFSSLTKGKNTEVEIMYTLFFFDMGCYTQAPVLRAWFQNVGPFFCFYLHSPRKLSELYINSAHKTSRTFKILTILHCGEQNRPWVNKVLSECEVLIWEWPCQRCQCFNSIGLTKPYSAKAQRNGKASPQSLCGYWQSVQKICTVAFSSWMRLTLPN